MLEVRVRFAPSPTGYLHIGGARTAIFNYLFARKNNGKFVLRIEDTDIDRSLADSESKILEDMRWLGIVWDEGPDKNGHFGPYRQTERLHLYKEYAEKLLKEGNAYHCWCTPDELEEKRKKAFELKQNSVYDGRCLSLKEEEIEAFKREGRVPAIRFKSSKKRVTVKDLIKGDVEFKEDSIGDFIILKSDGTASYNFAVVIDDSLMKITHVIRGDEHLINTPRQIMLYEALGMALPEFAHIPMILAPDHTKLSKRHGTTSVGEFREKGYLADALVNYLALLGWSPRERSPREEKEFFTTEELINEFSLDRVAKNPAIYDTAKLNWMNFNYMKRLCPDDITKKTIPYLVKEGLVKEENISSEYENIKNIIDAARDHAQYFGGIPSAAKEFFNGKIIFEPEAAEIVKSPANKKIFDTLKDIVSKCDKVDETNYKEIMKQISDICGVKGRELYMPVRAVLTGKTHGPELVKIFKILGVNKTIERLNRCLGK